MLRVDVRDSNGGDDMHMKWRRAAHAPHLRRRRVHPRHVVTTMMFTDIVGSTGLLAAAGDDVWVEYLMWHDVVLRHLFGVHGGREVKQVGDGFFVVFDDPAAALACGLSIIGLLANPGAGRPAVPVRVGIHRSEVIQVGRDYAGRGVHEAARILDHAGGGELLVSAGSVTPAAVGFVAEPPRTVTLRGLPDRVDVVCITAAVA
jgi:class 3 adenylate cyclase